MEAAQSSSLGPVVSTLRCVSWLDPYKHPILKMDWEQLLGFFSFLSPLFQGYLETLDTLEHCLFQKPQGAHEGKIRISWSLDKTR